MRVAITGATGYLGSHLAARLAADGIQVVALSRDPARPRRLAGLAVERRRVDDPAAVEGIDAVVHAAASYGRAGEDAAALVEANLLAPLRLLGAARAAGVARWITIGTALPAALSSYARSKRQFLAWAEAAGAPAHDWLACEHFYGPGDDEAKFVTRCLRAFLRGEAELALTAGSQRRDFLRVDDAVDAIAHLLRLPPPTRPRRLPLGTGAAVPVRTLVETLHRLSGARTRLAFGAVPLRADEPEECRADPAPLAALGWRAGIPLDDGLARLVAAERSLSP